MEPTLVRNTLSLSWSVDLINWEIRSVLLEYADVDRHGFQYVDWLFEGDDLIVVERTAYEDSESGTNSAHIANDLTLNRFENFREK